MKRYFSALYKQRTRIVSIVLLLIVLDGIRRFYDESLAFVPTNTSSPSNFGAEAPSDALFFYRRGKCSCTRPVYAPQSKTLVLEESSGSLCSHYSTLRGAHQKIIAISMYGPKENAIFRMNASLAFLHELLLDMQKTYPDWILRIYHDLSVGEDIICPIECAYHFADFCDTNQLASLGRVGDYVPPKIWRFLPAGDLLVDISASRDLDSPLTPRELAAVNQWLASNKSWHVMRDHPWHAVPMLGGMWGFRSALNREFARELREKILNRTLITRYGGRDDQTFLAEHVWPRIQSDMLAHDSHLCQTPYGKNSQPWPTRRPSINQSNCFVGCVRPCCPPINSPFGECPMACRPKNHPDWTMC